MNIFKSLEVIGLPKQLLKKKKIKVTCVGGVNQTQDLSLFKTYELNRRLTATHVAKLVKSIRANGFIVTELVIIDQHGNVLDGQHRISATRLLTDTEKKKINVPFIVVKVPKSVDTLELIQQINVIKRPWQLADYESSHMNNKKIAEDYKYLYEFRNKYSLSIRQAYQLLTGSKPGGHVLDVYREGRMVITNKTTAEQSAKKIAEIRDKLGVKKKMKDIDFKHWAWLVTHKKYDHKRMLKQLSKKNVSVRRLKDVTNTNYLDLVSAVYNLGYTNTSKEVDFECEYRNEKQARNIA